MLEINVKADVAAARRELAAIRAKIPSITARALNETAVWARKTTIDKTASDLRLPRKNIAKTTRRGEEVDRFRLVRANRARLESRLRVISAGIQVTDVAQAWIGRKPGAGGGVKARGGRFYRGAFKAPGPGGKVRVWKRRGKQRLPIFLPRIGTRKAMETAFDQLAGSEAARRVFLQRFDRLARFELRK